VSLQQKFFRFEMKRADKEQLVATFDGLRLSDRSVSFCAKVHERDTTESFLGSVETLATTNHDVFNDS